VPRLEAGQTAIVTGGAQGIGYALVEAFLRKGLNVVVADIDQTALERSIGHWKQKGGTVLGVPMDVSNRQAMRELRETAIERFGSIHVLCNNAGVYKVLDHAWKIDLDGWRALFEVNYWGVVYGIHEFVPLFLRQGFGHILNTASMSGLSTVPGSADYGSSKHAVIALSEMLRADLQLSGNAPIDVTVLCPAVVKTEMGDRALGFFANSNSPGDRGQIGSGPNLASVLDPNDVAADALRGIEEGRLYVTPTPGSRERFQKRVQPIFDALGSG
jgi:NAD(P)-dependent dehydrogenase (short-subunit alcohol dehydrogenase family)